MTCLRPILFGLCLAAFSLPAVCASHEVVRIGFAAPLTGPQAHYGQDSRNGAALAIEELNAADPRIGGRPVRFELVVEDDQASPAIGTVVAQRLVDRNIRAVAGHFNSGVTIPASRIYHDAGIPQLSVSTNVNYTRQGYRTAFRVMAADDRQGAALGQYAVARLGLRRFAVLDDRTAYGQGIADAFAAAVTAAGGQVVRREFTSDKDVDFRALLTTIRAASPEAIFFGGYDVQAGPMARQMRELGMSALLLGGETLQTAKFIELAGPAAEGHLASTPGAALEQRPGGKAFAERYRQRYGHDTGLYAPYLYDSVRAIAAAMQKAESSAPASYLPVLRANRYPGVTADIAFDAEGNLLDAPLSIFRVVGGKWVLQRDPPYATSQEEGKMLGRVLRIFTTAVVLTAVPAAQAEEPSAGSGPGAETAAPAPEAARPQDATPASKTRTPSNATFPDASSTAEAGIASVYAAELEGRPTASGALYDSQKLTAAHRSLPFGSQIRVTDSVSARSVVVTVNDRWSGGPGQILNLSRRAADELGLRGNGQRRVVLTVETLGSGGRQPSPATATPRILPERIEAVPAGAGGRTRLCANEADILGLRGALWETHVRNCLGRKAKPVGTVVDAKAK